MTSAPGSVPSPGIGDATSRRIITDTLVLGATPAGLAAAIRARCAGHEVIVVHDPAVPTSRVEALTPPAVAELTELGVETAGWKRTRGVRVIAAGTRTDVVWPSHAGLPAHGLVTTQASAALRERAVALGVRVLDAGVVTLISTDGRLTSARVLTGEGEVEVHAEVLLAGTAAALAHGVVDSNPAAAATAFTSPRHDDEWCEIWIQLPVQGDDASPTRVVNARGIVVGLGEGTAAVEVRLPARSRHAAADVLARWVATLPPEWGFVEENRVMPVVVENVGTPAGIGSGGVLLLDDDELHEGLRSARVAAVVASRALSVPRHERDAVLAAYPHRLAADAGGHRMISGGVARLGAVSPIVRLVTLAGLPHPAAVRWGVALMADMTDHNGVTGEIVNGLGKIAMSRRAWRWR